MTATSSRPRSIVVAIDFAEMTDYVLASAVAQASFLSPTVVHVVCAIGPNTDVIVDGQVLVDEHELDALEEAMCARVADRMDRAGVVFEVHAVLGRPGAVIADLAREVRAVLVVIGRHSRARNAQLGSVPAEILGLVHCSVLVAQPVDYGDDPVVL